MTKVRASLDSSKDGLRIPKNGSINKKKNQKVKKSQVSKMDLKNGSSPKNNGKQNGDKSKKSPKTKKSPKGNASDKNGDTSKKSPATKIVEEEEEEDDSDDDINEGITVNEIVSGQEDEVDDDDSSDDDAVPDIFGTSLAEETDDSDEEFDADDDVAKVDIAQNKGVKMFKGVEKVKKQAKKSEDNEEEDDDDEDDDDEDEDEDEEDHDKSAPGLSALLGDSIKDESDDEDFIGVAKSDDDDEDDDDEEDDESDEEVVDQSLNSSNVMSTDDDDEDDEDDDDDDDDVDEEESSSDLDDILVKNESDDDSEEDEDDEDDEKNESHDSAGLADGDEEKSEAALKEDKAERDKRTIFVGNVPKDTKTQRLSNEFKKFGPIDTIRIRGIIPENPKMPLKVAAITKKYHPKLTTVCAFITYKSEDSVAKALSMNGKKLDGNYLRVDRSEKSKPTEKKKSVFLGNLPFTVEDNDVWEAFKDCGKIESVRIIRDRKTGLGRGFGYINFENADGAVLALDLNGTTINDRELRVKVIVPDAQKKPRTQQQSKKRQLSEGDESDGSPKKIKTDDSDSVEAATRNSLNAERRKKKGGNKRSQGEKQRDKSESTSPQGKKSPGKFQGETADAKKKPKQDKSARRKKQMAAKLLAKPKKPSAN